MPVPAGTRLEQDASDDGSGAALAQRFGSSGVLPRHSIEGDKGRPGGQRLVEPCKADTAIMIAAKLMLHEELVGCRYTHTVTHTSEANTLTER